MSPTTCSAWSGRIDMLQEYWKYDGLGLAKLIRDGELTPLELVDSACQAVARLNPGLNAICHDLSEHARAACRKRIPQGPFAGVPFLLKDIGAQMKGAPYECGSRLMKGNISAYDSHLTERFVRAGL